MGEINTFLQQRDMAIYQQMILRLAHFTDSDQDPILYHRNCIHPRVSIFLVFEIRIHYRI